ncbi:helix-turn-helix transcriptional regulator [Trichocoleus sp. FACHB-591]|uniref:helix-turn-helix domain-containing protein n=1 Tax=Trichocoleus sp. FACHB-591 TaxID=2692872 RepID=UPI001685E228|nr:helix-turn-helix transcriptional regulator [Trichocoleus sp. FACHB-591]
MNFSQALDRTLEEFGISAKWLAERAGVSQQMISQFRNGQQRVYNDSLEKMLAHLPSEAKQYFFSQLGASSSGLEAAIEEMDNDQLSHLLLAIAGKLKHGKAGSRQLLGV